MHKESNPASNPNASRIDHGAVPFSMRGGLAPQQLTEAELERVAGGTYTGTLPIEIKCDPKGQCTSQGDCD